MYADVDRATIAFNKGGALYFNLRCFVQSHTRVPYGTLQYDFV